MDLKNINSIYFLGIGGIGMSALARYFNASDVAVCGYDSTPSPLTQKLISEGISIHFKENINLIPENIDLVVYTPAIPETHSEYQHFLKNRYNIKKRSEVLGMITDKNFTIAVAGTHGKTTITSLIAHILQYNGKDITAFVGGITKNFKSNLILSQESNIMVVEADEFDRSFLSLNPDIAIISSMDADHLDIYETKDYLTESFMLFQDKVKSCGKLIIKKGLQISNNLKCEKVIYALDNDADISASNIRVKDGKFHFDLNIKNIEETSKAHFKQNIPGRYNIENALAAIAVCEILGINQEKIKKALESYHGVERRFDYKIKTDDLVYIDDYAHHPEEIKACINAVKELYPDKKITGIFQPHLYSRTRDFADEFAVSLELLDNLILLEIYPARELPIEGVSSKMLYDKINLKSKILCDKTEVTKILGSMEIEILVTLGAGDIDQLVNPIQDFFTKKIKE